MAQPSPAPFSTYDAIGNREDLTNKIWMISPTHTPFQASIPRANAIATLHEWQTDALASASQNIVIEGNDAVTDVATATTRLTNYCQISDKVPRVTRTQEVVSKAGRKSEMALQVTKAARELRRDMENDLCANNAKAAGSDSVARALGGLPTWLATNLVNNDGKVSSGDGSDTYTDGTAVALTEAKFKTAVLNCFNSGGDPDLYMVTPYRKQLTSTFTGNATRVKTAEDSRLNATIDLIDTDFGQIEIVPNRFQPSTYDFVLEKRLFALAFLDPFRLVQLARDGDSDRKQLIVEFTMESRNEAGSAMIADLLNS